ncbi:hypothetical protein MASR2M78_04850 [Treponema sp.]
MRRMSQSLRFLKRALHFLAIAVLLSGIVSNAFAGGRKENALSKADRLISERRYNDAILALTTFMKEEPLRFDDAQKRLQKIVRLRDEYNTIAGELLDVLVNDPTNDERKLAMIKRLEELEAAPNRSAKEFLSRTKETALFTYNRAQFEKIMADGRALIDRNEFTAAARRYTDGFVLYRDEFYAEGYGDLVVSRVDGGIRTINSDIERFSNLLTRLSAAIAALEAALAQAQTMNDYASSLDAFQRAESLFLEFASIRNSVASSGRSLENQFLLLQGANKNIVESSFLPFAYRFVLGRKTEPRPEGILGSMDTLWINSANKVETASIAATDRLYASALNNTSGGEATALALDTSAAFADLSQRSLGLWAAIAGSEAVPALTSYGRTIVSGKVPLFLKYRTLFRAATYHAQAQREGKMLADLDVDSALNTQNLDSGLVSRQVSLSTENRLRATFKEVQTRVERQVQDLDAYAISVEEYQAKDLISPESSVFWQMHAEPSCR